MQTDHFLFLVIQKVVRLKWSLIWAVSLKTPTELLARNMHDLLHFRWFYCTWPKLGRSKCDWNDCWWIWTSSPCEHGKGYTEHATSIRCIISIHFICDLGVVITLITFYCNIFLIVYVSEVKSLDRFYFRNRNYINNTYKVTSVDQIHRWPLEFIFFHSRGFCKQISLLNMFHASCSHAVHMVQAFGKTST